VAERPPPHAHTRPRKTQPPLKTRSRRFPFASCETFAPRNLRGFILERPAFKEPEGNQRRNTCYGTGGRSACLVRKRNSSTLKGFSRKEIAPAVNAAACISGSPFALITITLVSGEISRSRAYTSRPLIFGIRTSKTAKGTVCSLAWARNSSGSSKLLAFS
jgi:hypothetical protein